jgi:acyl-CoA hydrolase
MAGEASEIFLRFLAAPFDITYGGTVHGGKLLEWIDKAGYACAVGWSAHYCVTAYVGDVHFTRPVGIGELVEVSARLVHTGRSSMHILVVVSSADPKDGIFTEATRCLTIFVAVDAGRRPVPVPRWQPTTDEDTHLQEGAIRRIQVRAEIEAAMKLQTYSDAGTAPQTTLRFLVAPLCAGSTRPRMCARSAGVAPNASRCTPAGSGSISRCRSGPSWSVGHGCYTPAALACTSPSTCDPAIPRPTSWT